MATLTPKWNDGEVLPARNVRPPGVAGVRTERLFCALMGRGGGSSKKDALVVVTSDPVHTAVLHNTRVVATKETHGGSPNWRLVSAAAFTLPESAFLFSAELVNGTRGFDSKRRRFSELARRYHVPCYVANVGDAVQTLSALRKYAPRRYAEVFAANLEEACGGKGRGGSVKAKL